MNIFRENNLLVLYLMFRADRILSIETGKVYDVDFIEIQNFRIRGEVRVRMEQVERLHLRVVQLLRPGLGVIKFVAWKTTTKSDCQQQQ